ncbi:MAG: acyl-CoA desaturase [Planctomycetaceae bacterium]|nr:acyl-CoA desaturase [Planctomycetaceae bacterium]MCP4463382.1 acyl-CoA desaturase [Planctomycetaceae bacterium]MDG1807181.1 fatty acid desaturase [Pirellulaceae bacterium]MDG2104953.1 fatty acid desaturase [Pirellulaceae bacterium]
MATDVKPVAKPLSEDDKIAKDIHVAKERTNLGKGERLPKPAGVQTSDRLLWEYIIPVIVMHLAIPFAFFPYFFSWWGVAWLFVGNFLFTSMGIGAGYHRLLTHRGFKCPKWFEYTLATLGVCSFQDSPGRWVLVHRVHHQHSDHQPDPHTPRVSAFWAHMGWLFIDNKELSTASAYDRYVRDLMQDRYYMWLQKGQNWILVYMMHALLLTGVGSLIGYLTTGTGAGALQYGSQWLMWGVVMRTIWTWHVTWAINSAAHIWGYRNYETREDSTNNWLFALLTNGEGWHNNHHADPRSARHGHRWWEIDMTWITLRGLEKIGIVKDLVHPNHSALNRKAIKT